MGKTTYKAYIAPDLKHYTICRRAKVIGYSDINAGIYGICDVVAKYHGASTEFIFTHWSNFVEITTERK